VTDRAELERRLRDAVEILEVEPDPGADAGVSSMRMRMSLEAAALVDELELGEERVREWLTAAGRDALAVFGVSPALVGDLDTGRLTADTSSANPLTLLYGLYAALAAGQKETARALAGLSPAEYRSKQAQASTALSDTARTLRTAVLGERAETARLAAEALRTAGPQDGSYPAELAALAAWAADAEPDRLVDAVDAVAVAVRSSAEERGGEDEPAVRLALPARGLRALFAADQSQ
jgi:hypothetical protein